MSDCGTSNTLSLDFISNKMLPDRKYLMGNMNFSSLKQIFCISIWYIKMIVKEKHTVIDMHPFSQDALLILKKENEAVCFDSIFEGHRGLYIVNLD